MELSSLGRDRKKSNGLQKSSRWPLLAPQQQQDDKKRPVLPPQVQIIFWLHV